MDNHAEKEAKSARIGLVGCGRWGRNIARSLKRIDALECIHDPAADDIDVYARELGVRVEEDLDVLLSSDVDGIAIAAPAILHAEMVELALRAGKHVFVEKPLALDLAEARRVAQEAEDRNLVLMVGHLLQYHPAFIEMCRQIADGAIGDICHISSNRLNSGQIRTEENALWSMAPHDFSMVLRLANAFPEAVSAQAVKVVNPQTPDQFHVQLQFPDAVTGNVAVSWVSPFKEHKLTVLGTTGAMVFEDTADDPARKLVHYPGYVDRNGAAPKFVKGTATPIQFEGSEPLVNEMQWFVDSVLGKKTPLSAPEEAIPVLQLLQMATRAAGL